MHSSLEKLYNDINNGKTVSLNEILNFYLSLREKKENEAQEQWWEIVINGDLSLDEYKNRWKKYLQSYFDKHAPFEDIKVIDTELKIYFEVDDNINRQWYIDRLDKIWDSFVINDYKTNKRLPSEDKESMIEQLTLYGFGIKQKYGKYFKKMKAKLYFLHFDIEDERELTDELINKVLDKYKNIIKEIEHAKKQFNSWNKTIFEAKQSPLCRWCDYQSICPLFNAINSDDEVVSDLSEKTIKALVDDFVKIKEQIAELERQEKWLKEIFQQYVIAKDTDNDQNIFVLQWSHKDIKITKNTKYKILDKEQFLEKIKWLNLYEQVSDIARRKVDDLFQKEVEVSLDDFMGIVGQDISYGMRTQKKKW